MAGARRYNVLACGRRFGKSTLAAWLLLETALKRRQPAGYFAPTYKLLLETWRDLSRRLRPALARANATERRMDLLGGGSLEFWTLEDPDAGRSRKYARAIIDEAGLVPDLGETWQAAIRPTLADLQGDAWFLGTPKGRNFFWQAFQRGADGAQPEWAAWQLPTSCNPHIAPQEIAAMRADMSERRYLQEVEAQFLEDSGSVFRSVRAAVRPVAYHPAHSHVIGVDWGRSGDYTVCCVVDADAGAVVALDRYTGVAYAQQAHRLRALWERCGQPPIVAEANSIGGPVVEALQRAGLPVRPFVTTNASKAQAVDALALAFERGGIALPEDAAWLVAELEAFEAERLPSGLVRYGAPEGMHDDGVMALAIAWQAAQTGAPLISFL